MCQISLFSPSIFSFSFIYFWVQFYTIFPTWVFNVCSLTSSIKKKRVFGTEEKLHVQRKYTMWRYILISSVHCLHAKFISFMILCSNSFLCSVTFLLMELNHINVQVVHNSSSVARQDWQWYQELLEHQAQEETHGIKYSSIPDKIPLRHLLFSSSSSSFIIIIFTIFIQRQQQQHCLLCTNQVFL